ncbi:predicted protein [Arabidopsis lyrata subsp. lyrata]|uniref:Predicted protein n=1 Tax=Arabidopsis lyrata subsp. lyrata TaxID=81972 RepID=D7M5W7_ARALL|nr:predicted protein [Arabidopsis lyrata subsp. lyrata]
MSRVLRLSRETQVFSYTIRPKTESLQSEANSTLEKPNCINDEATHVKTQTFKKPNVFIA